MDRMKNTVSIIFPLLFSSMERIDVVSNAMELRGFGKKKTRTWYVKKKMTAADFRVIAFCIIMFTVGLIITNQGGSNIYNPFVR